MKNLYTKKPTDELIQKALFSLGFDGLQDFREVSEQHIVPHIIEEVKDELKQYMYPVFYKDYVQREEFGYKNYLTLVRQLLRTKSRRLIRKERCELVGDKTYRYVPFYTLDFPATHSGVVSFDN
jgi:hypothetical protein